MRELVVSGSLDGASTDFIDGRTLVDGFPGPAFVSDARGRLLFANERWMAVCGRSLDGPNGHDWRDAVDALERDRARALWTLAVTADEPRRDAFGLGSPEGGYRLYSCRTAPVRAEGRAACWIGVCVEIADATLAPRGVTSDRLAALVDAHAAIAAGNGHAGKTFAAVTRAALSVAPNADGAAIELVDGDAFVCRAASGMAVTQLGLDSTVEGSLSGLSVDQARALIVDNCDTDARVDKAACRRLGIRSMVVVPLFRRGGAAGVLKLTSAWPSTFTREDALLAQLLVGALDIGFADVAERALAASEAALSASREDLRRANGRLAAEKKRREQAQVALAQAQKLEALGQLTSGIAHDFNNVTQAVAGGFAIIEKRTGDPRIADIARHGAAAAQRGGQLVKQMLAFARHQVLAPQRVDLGKQLAETRPLLAHTLGAGIRLTVECLPDTSPVRVDPTLLETALINLAANARDAMPGGGEFAVRVRDCPTDEAHRPPELQERRAVAIAVTDSGAGIGPAVLQRASEPFFTTKSVGKGTGLGLAMVQGFVRQSDGALRIESHEGKGTTVTVYLPSDDALEPVAQAEASERAGAAATPSLRILLVDEDQTVRSVIAAQLSDFGHSVVQANGAQAALAAFQGEAADVAICDIGAPGVDGPALAAMLRERRPALPVLFMTAHADREPPSREPVLRKPFTPAALAEALAATLSAEALLMDDNASLDRLAARLKSDALRELLAAWRAARGGAAAPRFDASDFEQRFPARNLIVVEVDAAHAPLRFHMAKVGGELEAALGRPLTGSDLAVTGDDDPGSLEAAYRRCVRTGRPIYDFVRFGLGDAAPDTFERLVTPWSTDGHNVDRLAAIAVFTGPAFPASDSEGSDT